MTISHNSHSGFQMQSWRSRRMNAGRERTDGRRHGRVWTAKWWFQGNIHHCRWNLNSYVCVPPADGGIDKLWNNRTQRTRSCFTHVSRQQKKESVFLHCSNESSMSKLRKWESMQSVMRRWVSALTSSRAGASPSWRADVIWNSLFTLERPRVCRPDPSLRGVGLTLTGCCCRIIWKTESNFWGRFKRKRKEINLKDVLYFNTKVQGVWLQQITD